MKNKLKKALSLVLAITLAFSLVSCFEDETTKKTDAQNKQNVSEKNIDNNPTINESYNDFNNDEKEYDVEEISTTKNVYQNQTVSLGGYHSAVIMTDGSLWMWGYNWYGQLGDGTTNNKHKPTKIMDNVRSVCLGYNYSAAIKNDGSLWMWGDNSYGRLGDGTTNDAYRPIKIMDDVETVRLGGYHSAAIKTDGTLWLWGYNFEGRLGDGTTEDAYRPIKIMDDVEMVSLGRRHTAAIKTDGTLWMWGYNYQGQLGDGTRKGRYEPTKVMDDVEIVRLGDYHSAVIKTDASLWMWGDNGNCGNLGDGTTKDRYEPVKIMDNVKNITLCGLTSAAIKTDGSLWTWGFNSAGRLGDGTTNNKHEPTKIMDDVEKVCFGAAHGAAVKTDGSLWMWGDNGYGELGNGSTTTKYEPVKIMDDVVDFSLGDYHSSAIKTDGTLWTWGYNYYGQLGGGAMSISCEPINIEISENNYLPYEYYFADNIGNYLDQITGLKLPYSYLVDEAKKRGLISWDLLLYTWDNGWDDVLYDEFIAYDPTFMYKTLLLDILSENYSKNNYNDDLEKRLKKTANDVIDNFTSDLIKSEKNDLNNKINSIAQDDTETIQLLTEQLKKVTGQEKVFETVKNSVTVFDSATDIVEESLKELKVKDITDQTYYALCAMEKACSESKLENAFNKVIEVHNENKNLVFVSLYLDDTGKRVEKALIKELVKDLTNGSEVYNKAETATDFILDASGFASEAIYPCQNAKESMLKLACICQIENCAKQALKDSYNTYKSSPNFKNAQTVIGCYDFLMSVYDFGTRESELYADLSLDEGLFNKIYNFLSGGKKTEELESAKEWIDSYDGQIEDVKWYSNKARIEYGIETNRLTVATVVTLYEGKVANSYNITVKCDEVYSPGAFSYKIPIFENTNVSLGDFYYDEALTQPYTPIAPDHPITLYRELTIDTTE